MDSYRDTTIISDDEESSVEDPSEDDSDSEVVGATNKFRRIKRIISSDSESDEDKENVNLNSEINKKDDAKNTSQAAKVEKSFRGKTSLSRNSTLSKPNLITEETEENEEETEENEEESEENEEETEENEEGSEENEEETEENEEEAGEAHTDDNNEFKDFLINDKFNSTTFVDEFQLKSFPVTPAAPLPEEEEELMQSIYEQATLIEPSVTTNSRRSSRISGTLSNVKTECSEEIINSTVESVKVIEDSVEEIIISDSDSEAVSPQKNLMFKNMTPKINTTIRQMTLPQMLKKEPSLENSATIDSPDSSPVKKQVSRMEYVQLKQNLEALNLDKRKLEMALRTIQLDKLPDSGRALLNKQNEFELKIKAAQDQLSQVEIKDEPPPPLTWGGIEAGTTQVQPRTFGKQAMQTYNTEKSLTLDRLQNLHGSLKTCPTPETLADDPKGLKVELMLHQKHALAWLLWREQQKPAGGILADDMGLGKTLTMLSLAVAHNELNKTKEESESEDENETEEEQRQFKYNGGTLIVCPASLLGQWVNEISDKFESGTLSVETYHGAKRETKAKRLSRYDVVVTTYAICQYEGGSDTPLYRVKWERIILDEAHQIRNHKSKTSLAVFRLGAKRRWALTGTPVHNREMDLFALLKFLRCSPFDDVAIFKRWISTKSGGGHQRLHTVLSSMLLRRTKEQLKEMEQLTCLPEREWQLVEITMDKDELEVYQKILLFSKTLFAQFLHQRAEKNADGMDFNTPKLNDPSNEYYKMHKKLVMMNKLPEVKQSDILVLLLRLRQICCHPSLITAMLDTVSDLGDVEGDADMSMDLLDQLNKLNIEDHDEGAPENALDTGGANAGIGLAEASRNLLNPSNPVFDKGRQSAKVREVIKVIQEKIIPVDDKAIIVSQWTSLLHLMTPHLDAMDIKYCHLDGTIPVKSRSEIVNNFNNPKSGVRIMLLSLTAGGVGLNLVGANHLFFLDLHWNPQLEMQAQDRIYRVGQRKKVFVYKFMTVETIEQRIKCLQDKKKEMAEAMLKGAKMQHSKLSMDDLKMLFNM